MLKKIKKFINRFCSGIFSDPYQQDYNREILNTQEALYKQYMFKEQHKRNSEMQIRLQQNSELQKQTQNKED